MLSGGVKVFLTVWILGGTRRIHLTVSQSVATTSTPGKTVVGDFHIGELLCPTG